jgi:hypothetical protein
MEYSRVLDEPTRGPDGGGGGSPLPLIVDCGR